ncbi:MAG TPA: serine/threonine-protein kinase [Drouetiella sp.]
MTYRTQITDIKDADLDPEGEVVLRYRPYASAEKWVKHRFATPSGGGKLAFVIVIIVGFFVFGGPEFVLKAVSENFLRVGQLASQTPTAVTTQVAAAPTSSLADFLVPLGFFMVICSAAWALIRYLSHPTHVSLSRNGVCLEWHRGNYSNGKMMPWNKIERIEWFMPPEKTSPQDSIIRFKEIPTANSIEEYPLQLKLGCIASSEERHKLLKAIQLWGANIPRDSELMDVLTPAQDDSYTELWLQALSAPPKRERLTPLAPGAVLHDGKYRVDGQLGVGGQGTAYLAKCATASNAEVVLKEFILPVYVDVNVRRQALESMQHEAAMLKRLDNNRVVRLIEFFVEDHRGYLVLERIDGLSLRGLVNKEGPMPEAKVRELAQQMCSILAYLHNLSPPVVHRDFTPDNLILGKDGVLKLVDFNVAQQTESTATGTVVGKHSYLPPEQFRGRPIPQSDIYAMGATLYYLLLGQDPEPITCSHPITVDDNISPELDAIIAHATALDSAKRYAKAEEIENDLNQSANDGNVIDLRVRTKMQNE